jgi:hypothetical protein
MCPPRSDSAGAPGWSAGQCQREQDQQDDQGDRDAEAPTGLGRVDRGQGRGRLFFQLVIRAVALEQVALVDAEHPRIGLQVPAHEHVGRQIVVLVVLELLEDPYGNARGLRNLGHRDLAQLTLTSKVIAQRAHQYVASR